MRISFLFLICCFSALISQAQISKTLHLTTAGTLSTKISVNEQNTITNLSLTGNLNAVDFAFVRDKIKHLSILDLSGVNIVAYSGTGGTFQGEYIDYAADELPHYAFYNPVLLSYKPSLNSVILPTSITSIGYLAFYYCWNITSIQIPVSVKKIPDYTFYGCYSLGNITVPSSNSRYSSVSGVLFNKAQDTLLVCPNAKGGAYVIPSTVKHVAHSAFENCFNLSLVSLPTSLISTGTYAFANCSGISNNLNIPENVTTLGDGSFYGCYNLTGIVTIPESLVNIGSFCFMESNGISAFEANANNPRFSTHDNMLYSKNLDTLFICPPSKTGAVTILNTVKLIGSYAFYNCTNLSGDIHIPQHVDYIGYYAFLGCLNIDNYTTHSNNDYFIAENGVLYSKNQDRLLVCPPKKSGIFILPDNLESIDPAAFNNCKDIIGDIHFPASFNYLGEFAFYNCVGISGFSVDKNNPYFSSIDGVLFTKNQDYLYLCPLSKSGAYVIPSSVKEIGYSAFDGCSNLTDIEIPSSVLAIGAYAFEYCTSLQNVKIAQNVNYIGSSAFYACANLQNLQIAVPSPPIVDYFTFEYAETANAVLTVPLGSKELYANAPYWSDFKNIAENQFNSNSQQILQHGYSIFKSKNGILIHNLKPSDQIEIYSINGNLLKKAIANSSIMEVNLLSKGVFIVKIQGITEKIIL